MTRAGFSQRNLQLARIRHDSRSWGIGCMYGIITKASAKCGEDCRCWDRLARCESCGSVKEREEKSKCKGERVQLGERIVYTSQLEKELCKLRHATGREYGYLIIEEGQAPVPLTGRGLETVCTIGIDIPSLMAAHEQSQTGLMHHHALERAIALGPKVIHDLKQLGFKGINTSDLYLHAHAYQH